MTKYICLLLLICGTALAAPNQIVLSVSTDTNGIGAATQLDLTGKIDTINASVLDGTTTGTLTIAYAPLYMSDVNLATNAVVASKTFRPRVDATDVAGAALTDDTPVMYSLFENDVTVSVTNAAASSVWRVVIITE